MRTPVLMTLEKSAELLAGDQTLWQGESPPDILYLQGKPGTETLLEALPERGLAIVGTRRPQPRSLQLLRKRIFDLRGTDLIIVSGFARGIDTAAHLAALEAGLPTVAVLGTGLGHCYPRENSELASRILAAGGLLVTEFAHEVQARPWHFLLRNRLIGGWCRATWVVEAGARSGALNTARWAREHHRDTYATPGFPDDPALLGNQTLLDRDHALPVWGIHSFGATWSALSTHKPRLSTTRPVNPPESDEVQIHRQIQLKTAAHGGALLQDLLDWSAGLDWPTKRFYLALQSGLTQGLFTESRGVLVAQPENQLPLLL